MKTFGDLDGQLRKEQWVPKTRWKARHRAVLPIASKPLRGAFSLQRVMHSDDPKAYCNTQEIQLCHMGIPFATWSSCQRNDVVVDFTKLEGLGHPAYNAVVDMLRKYVPEYWFAYVRKGYAFEGHWIIATPSSLTNGGPHPTNVQRLTGGKAFLRIGYSQYDEAKREYVMTNTIHGVVPDTFFPYNWSVRDHQRNAIQRIRRSERAKVRRVERQYEAAVKCFWLGCGLNEWNQKAINERERLMREAMETAVPRWLALNGRTTYHVDGVEYVDLYKGTVDGTRPDGTHSEYMSGNYSRAKIEYLPGTQPHDPHFAPHDMCGGGLHMCAKPKAVNSYVRFAAHIVICPVRVKDIILIEMSPNRRSTLHPDGDIEMIDKCKVKEVALPIKKNGQEVY